MIFTEFVIIFSAHPSRIPIRTLVSISISIYGDGNGDEYGWRSVWSGWGCKCKTETGNGDGDGDFVFYPSPSPSPFPVSILHFHPHLHSHLLKTDLHPYPLPFPSPSMEMEMETKFLIGIVLVLILLIDRGGTEPKFSVTSRAEPEGHRACPSRVFYELFCIILTSQRAELFTSRAMISL